MTHYRLRWNAASEAERRRINRAESGRTQPLQNEITNLEKQLAQVKLREYEMRKLYKLPAATPSRGVTRP